MMKRMLGMLMTTVFLGLAAAACAHHEGPLETAGRKTDEAADDVKDGAQKAGDDVRGK
jgi:hypothetical protein